MERNMDTAINLTKYTNRKTHSVTERPKDLQMDRKIERETDRHTGRQPHRQTNEKTDRQPDINTYIQVCKTYNRKTTLRLREIQINIRMDA
jgi:CRISPR/Cas system CSM-associated protein Csm5 (group 7 of RAMP superfamily)